MYDRNEFGLLVFAMGAPLLPLHIICSDLPQTPCNVVKSGFSMALQESKQPFAFRSSSLPLSLVIILLGRIGRLRCLNIHVRSTISQSAVGAGHAGVPDVLALARGLDANPTASRHGYIRFFVKIVGLSCVEC